MDALVIKSYMMKTSLSHLITLLNRKWERWVQTAVYRWYACSPQQF